MIAKDERASLAPICVVFWRVLTSRISQIISIASE